MINWLKNLKLSRIIEVIGIVNEVGRAYSGRKRMKEGVHLRVSSRHMNILTVQSAF